ncbi:histone-like nucleoid-structuring protein Lsr2 [Nocardioides limicola]|uniref:histone-like nucleoid-structuring protein Lsr2 n=1 Tax=Nocardioides limicola TaxID=2803368 RepID=UPI00193C3EBE|nr:Lsr2 family protein [Nocardioides sp. DJM-14]
MAQKVQILLVDDIDGTEADSTVTFGLDGTTYEIDLNEKNAAALREALAPYIGHARKVSATRRTRRGRGAAATSAGSTAEIREWARANGFEVSDRGRISEEVRAAWAAAN